MAFAMNEMPKLVANLTKLLKSKDNEIRETVRTIFKKILVITGPFFFNYILIEMKFFLK